jgi:3-dehydroquinate dehydratase I
MANSGICIGSIALGGASPKIIAPFTDCTPLELLEGTRALGLDLLEARIDCFSRCDEAYVLGQISRTPAGTALVCTIRSRAEGGSWKGTERERLALFSSLMPKTDAVDIELSSSEIRDRVSEFGHGEKKTVIVSYHNFEGTPPLAELRAIAHRAKESGANIVKIATTPRSLQDIQTLASLTMAEAEQNIIVLGMGDLGLKTRFLLPALGSLATFAYLDRPSAPGQLSVAETLGIIKVLYPESY